MEQRYIFSGHESFPSKSLWLKKGYDFVVQEKNFSNPLFHLLPFWKKTHVVNGAELYDLDFKFRKILLCCVLNFMGLDNSTLDSFVAKSNNHFLGMINKQKDYSKQHEEPTKISESEIVEKGIIV